MSTGAAATGMMQHSGVDFELRVTGERFVSIDIASPYRNPGPGWDREQWLKASLPTPVAQVCPGPTIRVLDMPIRVPGESFYRLPLDLLPVQRFVDSCFAHAAATASIDDRFFYLTCDTSWVATNRSQRKPGVHIDGFLGPLRPTQATTDYSYVAWNRIPTLFYPYGYDLRALDFAKHDVFKEIQRQTRQRQLPGIPGRSGWIYHMNDANCWHSAGINLGAPTLRSFWRLSASERRFDRLGNTINLAMDLNWQMVDRTPPVGLVPFA